MNIAHEALQQYLLKVFQYGPILFLNTIIFIFGSSRT